ncbi:type II toxin-antitoxin system YafQ family toxin [Mogibacterium timidum]|nr:type II toxin-antitoxin system YafQ family toxin [Mogibacterium timidum]
MICQKLDDVLKTLLSEEPLQEKYRDHYLTGDYQGFREF